MKTVAGTLTIKANEGFGARHDAVVYARSIVKMVAQYADGGLTDRDDLISVLEALGLVDKLLETAADLLGEEPEVASAEPADVFEPRGAGHLREEGCDAAHDARSEQAPTAKHSAPRSGATVKATKSNSAVLVLVELTSDEACAIADVLDLAGDNAAMTLGIENARSCLGDRGARAVESIILEQSLRLGDNVGKLDDALISHRLRESARMARVAASPAAKAKAK